MQVAVVWKIRFEHLLLTRTFLETSNATGIKSSVLLVTLDLYSNAVNFQVMIRIVGEIENFNPIFYGWGRKDFAILGFSI